VISLHAAVERYDVCVSFAVFRLLC
jgi:hypothetical protein